MYVLPVISSTLKRTPECTCVNLCIFSRLSKMVTDSLRKERYLNMRIFFIDYNT